MSKKIRTDIQALRALAVIAVVLYHLWPERLVGGFMGVDIFLVISGYLMTLTLLKGVDGVISSSKSKAKATGEYLLEFYARRIKRLIPAAAVTLVAILGLVSITGQVNLIQKTAEQVTAASLFVQNWLLANESVNYLAASEPPTAVQHFWSLSLEEQFYLVWPLLLVIIGFATVNLSLLYRNRKISGSIIPVAILAVAFFVYGYLLTKTNPSAAYFVTPARVWELIIGGLIAFLPVLKNYDLKILLPWLGLGLTVYALFAIGGEGFPGWHALIPVIGTALIIYGGTGRDAKSNLTFSNVFKLRPIQWIGDISYSLYLWHWPLIVLVPSILLFDIEGPYSKYIKLALLVASFIIAWLSYKFIEKPSLKIPLKKWQVYASFVLIIGSIAGASFFIAQKAEAKAKEGLMTLHDTALNKNERCFGARAILNSCDSAFGNINTEWAQYVKADQSLSVIEEGNRWCDYYRIGEQEDPAKYCQYGDTSSSVSIVVWGDSHSDHWLNALNRIGKEAKIHFIHFSSGTCSNKDISTPQCADRINFIKGGGFLENAKAIIFSPWINDNASELKSSLGALEKLTNTPVYLMQDVPQAGTQGGPTCFLERKDCTNNRESALSKVNPVLETLLLDKAIKESNIIRTEDMFCKNNTCYSFIGGVSVYRDLVPETGNSHISSVYSLSLADLLKKQIEPVLLLTKEP